MPGDRRGRIVERCRPTPELARSSAFRALALAGFEQLIQRARRGAEGGRRNGNVTGGGVDAAVAEQDLDDTDIGAVLQKMCGERMAQGLLILLMICTQQRFAIGVIRSMA